jgi:SAM-dependent methyltransferase
LHQVSRQGGPFSLTSWELNVVSWRDIGVALDVCSESRFLGESLTEGFMKDMYRVTRPAWARMEKVEFRTIFYATLAFLAFSKCAQYIQKKYAAGWIYEIGWPLLETAVLSFGSAALIWWYQRQRIGVYPKTFIYSFYMSKGSLTSGKSRVVGYCHIKPFVKTGKIIAQGASYEWDNGKLSDRQGFKSDYVYGTQDDDEETTCHIQFTLDKSQKDGGSRLYRHGLLQFRLVDWGEDVVGKGSTDAYVGYLQSTQKPWELRDVEVRSKGYTELLGKGVIPEDEVKLALTRKGDVLFGNLDLILRTTPQPSLWPPEDPMLPENGVTLRKTNYWGDHIPTPQSVILKDELRPHIDKLLTKMLALTGLKTDAIAKFKEYAISQAELDPEDSKASYESDLKMALVGKTVDCVKDQTLTRRANLISEQIRPFLRGNSLLDIGCGNGLITHLVRNQFKHIECLDVVQYLPEHLGLTFTPYKEGEPLPIDRTFDTVLLLTVLHHAIDPVALLKMAWGATSKRLIIIESVVGIHKVETSVKYDLLNSSDEDQVGYAAFVDWFYNRVLHNNVPVPYNFTTPERWLSVFLQHGMRLIHTVHLGQDIDIGPEYHILFVLEKENPS